MANKQEYKRLKEIERLEKASLKKTSKYYFIIFLIIVSLIYIVDEITSNINGTLNPTIIRYFYDIIGSDINSPEYNEASGNFFLFSMLLYVMVLLAPFYKSLADKIGRKIFLCINTLIMGLGMFICMISSNLFIFLIGSAIIIFSTPNDFQVLYIMEVAPKKYRNTIASITKAIGLFSVSLIGVFKMIFVKETSGIEAWRNVYFIPVVLALVIGIISFFVMNETPTFLHKRLEALKGNDNKKEINKSNNGGVINALKYVFKNKQTKWIFIACLVYAFGCGATNYYSNVFDGMNSQVQYDLALVCFPLANATITLFTGYLSDRIGRKKSVLVLGTLAALLLISYVVAAKIQLGGAVVGILYGCFIGCLYSASDILFLVLPSESTPTNLRASVVGTMSFMLFAGTAVSWGVIIVSQMILQDWGFASMLTIPFLVVAILITLFKVKETKGINLDTIE